MALGPGGTGPDGRPVPYELLEEALETVSALSQRLAHYRMSGRLRAALDEFVDHSLWDDIREAVGQLRLDQQD